jgi:TfoX/Sxy family transcriptional regulator of competence genes
LNTSSICAISKDAWSRGKMFGEYGFHLDGKFIALACDNSFFATA